MVDKSKKNIIKISIIIIILNLFFVYFIEKNIEPESVEISKISLFDINRPVLIKGIPKEQNIISKKHLALSISQKNNSIKAIFFNYNKTLNNEKLLFFGKLKTYNRNLQLQIMKIKKLN